MFLNVFTCQFHEFILKFLDPRIVEPSPKQGQVLKKRKNTFSIGHPWSASQKQGSVGVPKRGCTGRKKGFRR